MRALWVSLILVAMGGAVSALDAPQSLSGRAQSLPQRSTMDLLMSASCRLGLSPEDADLIHGGVLVEHKAQISGAPAAAAAAVAALQQQPQQPPLQQQAVSLSEGGPAQQSDRPKKKIKIKRPPTASASAGQSEGEMQALFNGAGAGTGNNGMGAVRRMDLQKIRNAVVQIVTAHAGFNWKQPWQAGSEEEVLGTGFFLILDGQSYILTNAHVVKGAIKVRVRVPDVGLDNFAADVFGICYEKDIALLKLRADDTENLARIRKRAGGKIEHLDMGDSDQFAQGSIAIAVGYPLGQANVKFSTGILSGFEHVSERLYLQITAPINPGNSGGPLLNNAGLVMGVNTAAYEKASNVGYAIPSSHIRALLDSFVKTGSKLLSPNPNAADGKPSLRDLTPAVIHAFPSLGVGLAPATKELCRFLGYTGEGGVFVRKIAPRGIANDAGLRPRDLLLAFDGHKLDRFGKTFKKQGAGFSERLSVHDLAERVSIGSSITFTVWRDGQKQQLTATFAHRPEHDYAVPKVVEPVRQKVQYVVVGGVVFMQLALNHIENLIETNPTLINYFRGKHRVNPRVVVSGVLPECTLPEDSVSPGELVTKVNGQPVSLLSDLQHILDESLKKQEKDKDSERPDKNWLTFETSENSLVVFDLTKVETRHGTANHDVGHQLRGRKHRKHRGRRGGGGRRRRGRGRRGGKGKKRRGNRVKAIDSAPKKF